MTQDQVKAALEQHLLRYMRDPDVDVSVKEYHSRQVAVVGMVQKPGLYTLTSRSDTILDMISKAGGMTEKASSRIIFVPAPKNGSLLLQRRLMASTASETANDSPLGSSWKTAAGAVRPVSADGAEQPSEKTQANHTPSTSGLDGVGLPTALQQANPIQIDLSSAKGSKDFVDLPARPGDVIIVPASGEVMVQGWVVSPGAFKITPGMTALGAVTAAGGEQFTSSATVLRTDEDGDKVQIPINLSKIKAGEERDVPVQSGDVVIVNRSAVGAVPYLVYSLFSKFGTGAYLPIPF
jgi:polysaccharide biosynthesis/export protein